MHLMQLNCAMCACVCITIKNLHSKRHVNAALFHTMEREKNDLLYVTKVKSFSTLLFKQPLERAFILMPLCVKKRDKTSSKRQ
jgi:hypothetical protein